MSSKYYEPRSRRAPKFGTCECGHKDLEHEYGFLSSKECEECMCPKYKFFKDLTHFEIIDLQHQILDGENTK